MTVAVRLATPSDRDAVALLIEAMDRSYDEYEEAHPHVESDELQAASTAGGDEARPMEHALRGPTRPAEEEQLRDDVDQGWLRVNRRRSAGIVRVAAFNLTYSIDLPRAPIAAVVDVSFDIFVFVRETAHGRFTTRARGLATRPGATNRPEVIATVAMVHPRRSLPLHSLRSHLSSVLTTELCRTKRTIPEIRDVDERRQSRTHRGSPREIGLPDQHRHSVTDVRDYLLRELLGDA